MQLSRTLVRYQVKDQDDLDTRPRSETSSLSPYKFAKDGTYCKDHPYLWTLFSCSEVVEGFASQDKEVYDKRDAFLMLVNRYPTATVSEQVRPAPPGVLALKVKVQTAQKWGMVICDHPDTPVITSGVPVCSIVGARDHLGRYIDVSSLTTLLWKVRDQAPVEQSTCNRGQCMVPSLERVHDYTLAMSLVQDRTPTSSAQRIVDFPTCVPENYNKSRGTRVYDQSMVTSDITYCDFKGFK